jgi:hypothetical protein
MYELELKSAKEARLLEAGLCHYDGWLRSVPNGNPDAEVGRERMLEEVEALRLRVHELAVKLTVAEEMDEAEVVLAQEDPQAELEEEARQERELEVAEVAEQLDDARFGQQIDKVVRVKDLKDGDVVLWVGDRVVARRVEVRGDGVWVVWEGLGDREVRYAPSEWLRVEAKPGEEPE